MAFMITNDEIVIISSNKKVKPKNKFTEFELVCLLDLIKDDIFISGNKAELEVLHMIKDKINLMIKEII